jgi:hypothetical protein
LLGAPRPSYLRLRLICFFYVGVMLISSVFQLLSEEKENDQKTFLWFLVVFLGEVAVLIIKNVMSNLQEEE